jgi:DUF971 family protein
MGRSAAGKAGHRQPRYEQMMHSYPDDVYPTSYTLDEEHRRLLLDWSDGHESVHDYEALRRACPCAHCAGEGNLSGTLRPNTPLTEEQTTLYELKPVGRYGLTPVWGDGHRTGIYTYERLRASCTCTECRQARRRHGS